MLDVVRMFMERVKNLPNWLNLARKGNFSLDFGVTGVYIVVVLLSISKDLETK